MTPPTQQEIDLLSNSMDLHTKEYEVIVGIQEKEGATEEVARRMLILVGSLLYNAYQNDWKDIINRLPYPDKDIMQLKSDKLMKLIERQKKAEEL